MKELKLAYEEYIEFLEKHIACSVGFLFAHGIYPKEEDVKKGEELRERIRKL